MEVELSLNGHNVAWSCYNRDHYSVSDILDLLPSYIKEVKEGRRFEDLKKKLLLKEQQEEAEAEEEGGQR